MLQGMSCRKEGTVARGLISWHQKHVLPQGTIVPQVCGRKNESSGRLPQEKMLDKDMLLPQEESGYSRDML